MEKANVKLHIYYSQLIMKIILISPGISLWMFSAFPYCDGGELIRAIQNFPSWPVQNIKLLRSQWIRWKKKKAVVKSVFMN